MILGQISYLDCVVFLIFLAPQLILQVGLGNTIVCGLRALPFLLWRMPNQLVTERIRTKKEEQSPFVQDATWFQDIVIRCVRYAFAYIPASVGTVFFSKNVALPFMWFRTLRHGYLRFPIHWRVIHHPTRRMKGLWIIGDDRFHPDIVIYYCHGGGFSMGSSYFYMEFLIAWLSLLRSRIGYRNPAVFTLEYDLVPNSRYPTQLYQTLAGYDFVLSKLEAKDSSRICVAGDSAGGTLTLSLLSLLARRKDYEEKKPGFATMISPWCTLVSSNNKDTKSDYLNAESLHLYARQYVGEIAVRKYSDGGNGLDKGTTIDDPMASPGNCVVVETWRKASPQYGYHFIYGAEEVFATETRNMIDTIKDAGIDVQVTEQPAAIHAWPVVNLFLGSNIDERVKGLVKIVDAIGKRIIP